MNPFKRNTIASKTPLKSQPKVNIESISDFPSLGNSENIKKDRESVSFLEMATKQVEEEKEEDPLKPGWVSLKFQGNKIIRRENSTTSLEVIDKTENEELQEAMNKALQEIDKRRKKYIDYYNEIHGQGEYENKYINNDMYISSDEEEELYGDKIKE